MKDCVIWGFEAWRFGTITGITGFFAGAVIFGLIAKSASEKHIQETRRTSRQSTAWRTADDGR